MKILVGKPPPYSEICPDFGILDALAGIITSASNEVHWSLCTNEKQGNPPYTFKYKYIYIYIYIYILNPFWSYQKYRKLEL